MSDVAEDWRPSCSVEMLRQRAELRTAMRRFFDGHGYLEVDTPILSHDIVVDAHLDPVEAMVDRRRLFLQTSPEAAMKRMLAAGSGSIYQITPAFRSGEAGSLHNPEFTMLEWYGEQSTWRDQIQLVEQLVRTTAHDLGSSLSGQLTAEPFRVTTYQQAFEKHFGVDVLSDGDHRLLQLVGDRLEIESATTDRDEMLNLLLATEIEPQLGTDGPEFLIDYPASQAALAELSSDDERVARRFELYVDGVEVCNGYQELTNADELRRRDLEQQDRRSARNAIDVPGAQRLLAAMDSGLPDCSGVALGLDRLLMALTGERTISEVVPFTVDRA